MEIYFGSTAPVCSHASPIYLFTRFTFKSYALIVGFGRKMLALLEGAIKAKTENARMAATIGPWKLNNNDD